MPKSDQEIIKKINNIIKKDKTPILLVKFETYDTEKRKITPRYRCGVFSSIGDDFGGMLWLKSISKGTRDKKISARMPMAIEINEIISIRHLNVQDLIDNTNRLAEIINDVGQEILM